MAFEKDTKAEAKAEAKEGKKPFGRKFPPKGGNKKSSRFGGRK